MLKHSIKFTETLIKPLDDVAATLDGRFDTAGGPYDTAILLKRLLEPDVFTTLPASLRESLREPVATYLATLPGDRQSAAEQHTLRLDLWNGDAQVVDDEEIEVLGLQEEADID